MLFIQVTSVRDLRFKSSRTFIFYNHDTFCTKMKKISTDLNSKFAQLNHITFIHGYLNLRTISVYTLAPSFKNITCFNNCVPSSHISKIIRKHGTSKISSLKSLNLIKVKNVFLDRLFFRHQ